MCVALALEPECEYFEFEREWTKRQKKGGGHEWVKRCDMIKKGPALLGLPQGLYKGEVAFCNEEYEDGESGRTVYRGCQNTTKER